MSKYPNCPNSEVATEATRPRPETMEIRKCTDTGAFFMLFAGRKVYPLWDRTDPNSDVSNRVLD